MRILIVSDTHGKEQNFFRALKRERPIDRIIHLGDLAGFEESIEQMSGCPCFIVRGNNDWNSPLPAENIVMLGKYRAFITHGHFYNVYAGTRDLVRHTKSLGCDVALYGHTHIPQIEKGEVTVLNPGSLTYPRQPGRLPSYLVAEADETGEVVYTLKYLEE